MGRFEFLLTEDEVVVRLVENYKARGHGNGLNQLLFSSEKWKVNLVVKQKIQGV